MKLSKMIEDACKEEANYPVYEFPKKLDEALGENIFMDGIDLDGHLKHILPDKLKNHPLGNFITYIPKDHYMEFHHSFFLVGPVIFECVTYVNHVIEDMPENVDTQMSLYEDVEIEP